MLTCPSHKKVYLTQEIAEDALIEARTRYDYAANDGPIGVYKCDDCGYFHLTSQGEVNAKLSKFQSDGKIDLQKEANRWEEKLKNKRR
jgi:hypothetical protein